MSAIADPLSTPEDDSGTDPLMSSTQDNIGIVSETIIEEGECEAEAEGVIQSPVEGDAPPVREKKRKSKKLKGAKKMFKSGMKTVAEPGMFVAKTAQKGVETLVVKPTKAAGKAAKAGVGTVIINPALAASKTAKKGVSKITGKKKRRSSSKTQNSGDLTEEGKVHKKSKNTSTRKSSSGKRKSKSRKSTSSGLSKFTKGLVGMNTVPTAEHEALKAKLKALEETNKKQEAQIAELNLEVASMVEKLDGKDKELETLRERLKDIGGIETSLEEDVSQTLDEKRAQKRFLEQRASILLTEGHDSDKLRELDDSVRSTKSREEMPESLEIVPKTKPIELEKRKSVENSKIVHNMRNMSTRNTHFTPHKIANVTASPLAIVDGYEPPTFPKTPQAVQWIQNALKKNPFFDKMDQTDLDRLIPSFEKVLVKNGTYIITQGDKADYFYIIARGKVIYKVDGKLVGEAGKDQSFGELSLLYTSPRAASVIALSNPTELFRIDQRAFRQILQKKAKEFENEKISLLREVKAFQVVTDSDMSRLADCMVMYKFKADQVVIRKGDIGSRFYIVRSGSMRVSDIGDGTSADEGVILKPRDYFGERALITDEVRSANVVGEEDGTCFSVDRDTFEKVLGKFSKFIMRSRDKETLRNIKNIKDSKFSDAMLETIASVIVDVTFKAGETIQEKGVEQQGALFLIRNGSVKIEKGGSSIILETGAYLGDDQISKYTPKTVTPNYSAICETDCTCGFLTLSQFPKLSLDGSQDHISNTRIMRRRSTIRESFQFRKVELETMEKLQLLGEGQFGSVHLVKGKSIAGIDVADNYALKVQDLAALGGMHYKELIDRERKVMEHMRHPFIADLIQWQIIGKDAYMLMNCITCGELWAVIHKQKESGEWESGMPEGHAKFYSIVIADAIACMHNSKIVYRDLKPENVMIDNNGYPNIIDFGFAKFIEGKTYTFCGTPHYIAPEIITNMGHSFGVDHWAFGILIYEMIGGENPFYSEGMGDSALLENITDAEPYPISKEISNDLKALIGALLEKDPTQRIGNWVNKEEDILKHKWFRDIDLNELREKQLKAPFSPRSTIEDREE